MALAARCRPTGRVEHLAAAGIVGADELVGDDLAKGADEHAVVGNYAEDQVNGVGSVLSGMLLDVRFVPLSQAKAHLSELIDSVDRTRDRVTITRNGRAAAVIVSASYHASLEATFELLMDPAAQDRVRVATQELAAGEIVSADDLAALLASKRPVD